MPSRTPESSIVVRPFALTDQAAAREVILAGMREHWGAASDDAMNADVDDIALHYANSHVVVACSGAEIVGTGIVTLQSAEGGPIGLITRMSTLAAHRRQGVARTILDHLVAHARGSNCTRLVLGTNAGWDDAVAFYRKYGFEEIRRTGAGIIFEMQVAPRSPDSSL